MGAVSTGLEANPFETDSPESWERVVEALGPPSLLVCISDRMGPSLRGRVAPEDVWQDALLAVWRNRSSIEWRGLAPFRRYVLQVVENRLRNLAEESATLKRGGGEEPLRIDDSAVDGPPPITTTTPSRIASDGERAARMQAALTELPDEFGQVVRLRLFEERSVAEVAAALGIGESAVKHRLRKGVSLYQASLEDAR